ncbi:Na(+)/Ca(+) antiporter [Desulfonema limicola]|uniref:Na(+)/Ca(+) antiporter n=1 Tax=Desulfonema limicola TaxID=45656 RepID=A0A975GEI5_9BACT|nr:calcium/sodium antiporter [Desulfonema limicola]QTA78150.1 Na(+)/Ca(+) antiporter [Desulfonema limicola]
MIAIPSLLIMIAAIYILSIITENFFVKSLDQISEKWNLPSSVAGASLMAAGSSAPELSIAIFSLFKDGGAHSDVGIGTIVGSAVFNILVITGISAIVHEAKITLIAVVRDTAFYLGSIILLLLVFWDGKILISETLLLLGFYGIYIGVLFFLSKNDEIQSLEPEVILEKKEDGSKLNMFITNIIGKIAGNADNSYIRVFFVSIVFISGLSWILVDSAIIFANAIGLPPVVVALTILAGGTSAPDLISSVVVAKQGRGDMAVANALGSNIFDILVCLGLPWLIAILFMGKKVIEVGTSGLILSVFILISTVVILFIFLFTDRLLSKKEGFSLVLLYTAYVVWTILAG